MEWTGHFAKRTDLMQRSAVREFAKVSANPDVISFAGGLPAPELLPLEELRCATETVLRREGSRALQYGPAEGVPGLREWIASRFSSRDVNVSAENVAIFNGSQQALDLLGRILLEEGDIVTVENPTYLAALSAWRPLAVKFEATVLENGAFGLERSRMLYVIPNFQNPRGSTLSLQSRVEIAGQACALSLPVIEDNPYGELRYEGASLPHLFQLAGGVRGPVIYTGTFSKVLAPGLRTGWVIAAAEVIEKLVRAKQAADLQTSSLNQYLALELVENGFLEQQLPKLRSVYKARRDAMLGALEEFMPAGVSWSRPEGGMFLMLGLPAHADGAELARCALQSGVAVVPGAEFFVDGSGRNTLRLNFSHPTPEKIRVGIERLAGTLRRTFPSGASLPPPPMVISSPRPALPGRPERC